MISFTAEQIILITGASSGIGRETALLCNALGATVIASARDMEKLASVRHEARHPTQFHVIARDVTHDMEALPTFVKEIAQTYGKLSGLVCSAGKTWNTSMLTYDVDVARYAFDLNCHAPLLLARGFAERRNTIGKGASIVFISAAAGVEPYVGLGMYGASKAALIQAARCLAKEIAPRGLRVNCISPNVVQTPMIDATVTLLGEEFLERETALHPLGLGEPIDVANMAAFLLSDKARWITGQNMQLSGGR